MVFVPVLRHFIENHCNSSSAVSSHQIRSAMPIKSIKKNENNISLSLQYDIIIHRLRKLASHPNAERVTPFLLQFLHVIPVQGMRPVEKKVGTDTLILVTFIRSLLRDSLFQALR